MSEIESLILLFIVFFAIGAAAYKWLAKGNIDTLVFYMLVVVSIFTVAGFFVEPGSGSPSGYGEGPPDEAR